MFESDAIKKNVFIYPKGCMNLADKKNVLEGYY